jgi:hypothetical protein
MLMKEPGDLILQHRNLTWFDVDNGMFEEFALNMGRQIVPPQEHRRPEALKEPLINSASMAQWCH